MLESFKRLFAAKAEPAPTWPEVEAWARREGLPFRRVREGEGFVIEGRLDDQPWRLEWGPPQRSYIAGRELRMRMELDLPGDLQMLLLAKPLMDQLERQTYESFTEGLQTQIDTLESQLTTLQTQATGLDADLTALETQTDGIATQLATKADSASVPIVTNWTLYTVSVDSGGTPLQNAAGAWRRVGDSIEVRVTLNGGLPSATGSSPINFGLPTGVVVDQNKIPGSVKATTVGAGRGDRLRPGPSGRRGGP